MSCCHCVVCDVMSDRVKHCSWRLILCMMSCTVLINQSHTRVHTTIDWFLRMVSDCITHNTGLYTSLTSCGCMAAPPLLDHVWVAWLPTKHSWTEPLYMYSKHWRYRQSVWPISHVTSWLPNYCLCWCLRACVPNFIIINEFDPHF